MRKAKYRIQNVERYELRYFPEWRRAEGWAVDRENTRYRIGFVFNYWWYEKLGFAAHRVYCEEDFIERNFTPTTPLEEVKHIGF